MAAILLDRSGSSRGRKTPLEGKLIRLGRKADNDVVFQEGEVSHYHAEIQCKGDKYLLVDLDSTNGTSVNERRVQNVGLRDRDVIELGENGPRLEFRIDAGVLQQGPFILPLSGSWQTVRGKIELRQGDTKVGRGEENDIILGQGRGSVVSTDHAVIQVHSDSCTLKDRDSTNGTFVNGKRVRVVKLRDGDRVELGEGGPEFEFHWKTQSRKGRGISAQESDRMYRKLVKAAQGGRAGDHTMLMLRAAHKYYKRRRWPLLVVCILGLAGFILAGIFGYRKVLENRQLTQLNNFYEMRISQIALVGRHDSLTSGEKHSLRDRRLQLMRSYEDYLQKVEGYANKPPKEKAVLRLARQLGETSLEVPADFVQTALEEVEKIKRTSWLRQSLERARERKLLPRIGAVLDEYDLPREFIFIPLWESGYDRTAVSPILTKYGIAKGLWQLMPSTAEEYGPLKIGPLKDEMKYDGTDERHNEDLSTRAAVRYLAFLYSSKAAASGLLVMASYNFGQTRIIDRLSMLDNEPREKNFWNFYRNKWIPSDTRSYVMSIFASALICENPKLFGVNMEPIDREW